MLVVGDREMERGEVALRLRSGENPGAISLQAFLERVSDDMEGGK